MHELKSNLKLEIEIVIKTCTWQIQCICYLLVTGTSSSSSTTVTFMSASIFLCARDLLVAASEEMGEFLVGCPYLVGKREQM